MKGRDVACAEQAYTGWDEENVDTDEMFENIDSGRSHSQSDLARNALPKRESSCWRPSSIRLT